MKRFLKNTIRWVPLCALMIVGFNNCSQFSEMDWGQGQMDNSSLGQTPVETDSEKLGIPIALLSAEQTLQSMIKVTNISTAPAAVLTEYTGRYGALAAGNDLSMANGPLMLGSTSLAGEVCNTLVTNERAAAAADRAFFGPINFAAGITSIDENAYNTAIRGMARQFWGRNENLEENTLLKAYKEEFSQALAANARTQAASTANVMTAVCAAMLSSLDAISY